MKAKAEGRAAYFDGNDTNPYPPGSTKHTFWRDGWNKGKRDYPERDSFNRLPLGVLTPGSVYYQKAEYAREVRGERV